MTSSKNTRNSFFSFLFLFPLQGEIRYSFFSAPGGRAGGVGLGGRIFLFWSCLSEMHVFDFPSSSSYRTSPVNGKVLVDAGAVRSRARVKTTTTTLPLPRRLPLPFLVFVTPIFRQRLGLQAPRMYKDDYHHHHHDYLTTTPRPPRPLPQPPLHQAHPRGSLQKVISSHFINLPNERLRRRPLMLSRRGLSEVGPGGGGRAAHADEGTAMHRAEGRKEGKGR